MKHQNRLIEIANPCQEPWSNMTINSTGRHCNICSKSVVDFTSMTDDEIKSYFIANTDKRTCGRFNAIQVNQKQTFINGKLTQTYSYIETKISHKLMRVSLLLIVTFMMTITGCRNHKTGDSAYIEDSTSIHNEKVLLGDTTYVEQPDSIK